MSISIEVVGQYKFLQIRETDEGGSHRRYIKKPGADFTGEPQEVLDARDEYHTPELVAAFQKRKEPQEAPFGHVVPRRVGSPREFLDLFSDAEQVAFFAAESANVELKVWWAKASTGNFSLDHPSVAMGLARLAQAGILTAARADEILGADFNAT